MIYQYKAKNQSGKVINGKIEANNLTDFYENMDRLSLRVLNYKKISGSIKINAKYRLKTKDLVLFCRKMSTMLSAGMSISGCLEVMYATEQKPKLKGVYLDVYESVRSGKGLLDSIRGTNGAFPNLLVNMIESGEESGNIDLIMDKLSKYFERQSKIAGKIKVATMYPKILAIVASIVVVILFTFVLPQIFNTFSDMVLPLNTRIMMWISGTMVDYWYLYVSVFFFLGYGLKVLFKTPGIRFEKDRYLLLMPKIGSLMGKIYSSRFASTLALLYSSGVSLISATRLSINVVDNLYIEKALKNVIEKVSIGQTLSQTLEEIDVFDRLLPSMVRIGEETGSLDTILISMSEFYESETEVAVESLLAILEPAILVGMAIIIGFILVSVIVPLFGMYGQIG